MLRMQEMAFPGFKFQKCSPRHPPYSCMVCRLHTWPSAIAIPSNILSHRKVPFQKMPLHGEILKKAKALVIRVFRIIST